MNAWPSAPLSTATYSNGSAYYFWTMPAAGQEWWPSMVSSVNYEVSLDQRGFDRLMLVRARGGSVATVPSPVAPVLERRPELVRRAPRPAGRPSGWRRARKGGRVVT